MNGIRIIITPNKSGAVLSVQRNNGGPEVTLPVANASFKDERTAVLFSLSEIDALMAAVDLVK